MANSQQSQSGDWSQYVAMTAQNASSDGSNLLLTSPLDHTSTTTEYQHQQYGPIFQNNEQSPDSTTTNTRQHINQYPMQDAYAQQTSRPGIQYQQLQTMQQPQQLAHAPAYMPHDMYQHQAAAQGQAITRDAFHRQLDLWLDGAQLGPQLNLNVPAATPIERSQSDMGPQTNAQSFGPIQGVASNREDRPGTSRSMGSFHPTSEWIQRPITPENQMSFSSSNAATPFNPVTPPHQMQTEAVDVTASNVASAHGSIVFASGGGASVEAGDNFNPNRLTISAHASNQASVDLSAIPSPSKAIGACFENLSVTDHSSQDQPMNDDDLFNRDSSAEVGQTAPASPGGSEVESVEDLVMHVPNGPSNEELLSFLKHDNSDERYPLRCTWPHCHNQPFARAENGKNHVQTHFGDKPWVCKLCGNGFVRPHDAKRHSRIHLVGAKVHRCDCGFNNARMDALRRHQERIACEPMRKMYPHLVKTPTKRGRPKKAPSAKAGSKGVTKSLSPKKVGRKRQQQVASAILPLLQSPSKQDTQPASPQPSSQQYAPVDQASFASVEQSLTQVNHSYAPISDDHSFAVFQHSNTTISHSSHSSLSQPFSDLARSFDATQGTEMNIDESAFTYGDLTTSNPFLSNLSVNPQQLVDKSIMLNNHPSTPPMSPTDPYSTGWNSPDKQDVNTPPGSPPDLSNSPAASSMGEELPSAAYGDHFENGDFADLLGPIGAFNKAADEPLFQDPA